MSWARRAALLAAACAACGAALAGPPPARPESGPAGAPPIHACVRLSGLTAPEDLAARVAAEPDPSRRRARLVSALRQEAAVAAAPLVARLTFASAGAANAPGTGAEPEVLWGPGVVCATAPRALFESVAALPGAAGWFEDPPRSDAEIDDGTSVPNRAVAPEAPLVAMHVPEAWDRGFTGNGVLVALLDTGIDLAHPDLATQLWTNPGEIAGNGIDDDHNGFVDDVHGWNFSGNNGDVSDLAGHGTDAAGLLAGNGTGGSQTGSAPGVTLMVIRRGTTESAMWAASQYALANGAQILSQSSSWRWIFSPRPDYASWRRQSDVELAAGMIHVNSAGNNGTSLDTDPIPYNVSAPANAPPPWLPADQLPAGGVSSIVAVGNVDAKSLVVAATSSYGPAEWTDIKAHREASYPYVMPLAYQDYPAWSGQSGLVKPDFVAAGDNSLTTKAGGGYETFTGTSAAAPRVAGLLALLKQAVPSATPADLYRALATTARDLGAAGRDARYGGGLPDVSAALAAAGPPLALVSVQVVDPAAPGANGDGAAEEGEIDRLAITLRNTSGAPLTGVDLVLTALNGVVVRDGYARLETIPAGANVTTVAPHFGIELPAGSCGKTVTLQLELRTGQGTRREVLALDVGVRTVTPLIAATFEADPGFTTSGTASAGLWTRAVPVGTTYAGQPANPAADGNDAGALCMVTGNGSTDPVAADVDGGRTTLTTPSFDTRSFREIDLDYARWFFGSGTAGDDRLYVEATGDGTTWKIVDQLAASENTWRPLHLVLSDLVAPGAATAVRFSVEDVGTDDVVEGGLDNVRLTGVSLSCTPFSIAPVTPGAVGPTLQLARAPGGHLRLTWNPPSAAGGIDPPHGYRVTASAYADHGFTEEARPAQASFVEVNGMSGAPGSVRYYVVDSLTD